MWKQETEKPIFSRELFEVFYQPQFNLKDSSLIGAEALIRSKELGGGFGLPGNFIPQMEESDVITAFDLWIVRQVCEFQRKRREDGLLVVPVSINLSMRTFGNPFNIYELSLMLQEFDLNAGDICLELTGTAPSPSMEGLEKSLLFLQQQGVEIILDDFGLGYVTLSMFRELPFESIKIDRYYLLQATEDQKKRTILKSIIQMANQLDVDVICEGVETEEEVQILLEFGCDKGQGFLYSEPLTQAEFEDLLRSESV